MLRWTAKEADGAVTRLTLEKLVAEDVPLPDQPIFQPSFVLHMVTVVLRFTVRLGTVLSYFVIRHIMPCRFTAFPAVTVPLMPDCGLLQVSEAPATRLG